MAFQIIEGCVNCWACAPLCPSQAIYEARPHFLIDAARSAPSARATTPIPSARASAPSKGSSSTAWACRPIRPGR